MKGLCIKALGSQVAGRLFSLLLECNIYDCRSWAVSEELEKFGEKFLFAFGRFCKQSQIFSICGRSKEAGFIDVECFADVIGDSWRCSCCKAYDSFGIDLIHESGYL